MSLLSARCLIAHLPEEPLYWRKKTIRDSHVGGQSVSCNMCHHPERNNCRRFSISIWTTIWVYSPVLVMQRFEVIYILLKLSFFICIYCHPRTDCFVLSEFFSVAGSKPVQLYVRLSFKPVGHQADYVGKGNFKVFNLATEAAAFVYIFIPYRIPECSILTKSFALR